MNVQRMAVICALAGALGSATAGSASTFTYDVVLTGTQENPPNASPAFGSASITLNDVTDILSVTMSFTGLTGGNASAAHIHCCAPAGTNTSVQVPFGGFPNTTTGTYSNTFNLNTISFVNGVTEASFIAGLESGMAYVNIHNTTFPGGEIRAQIGTPSVPEPSSLALLGTGLLGAVGFARRRLAR